MNELSCRYLCIARVFMYIDEMKSTFIETVVSNDRQIDGNRVYIILTRTVKTLVMQTAKKEI